MNGIVFILIALATVFIVSYAAMKYEAKPILGALGVTSTLFISVIMMLPSLKAPSCKPRKNGK